MKVATNLLESNLNRIFTESVAKQSGKEIEQKSFSDHVSEEIHEVDSAQKKADLMTTNLANGRAGNIHETMLALSHAELSFNFLVQLRNKGLEAYQEVMRMQV